MSTDVKTVPIESVIESPEESPVDPNTRVHIVNPPNNLHIWEPGMTSQDIVDVAKALGYEVKGLCGYIFIPKHSVENLDPCEACFEVAQGIIREDG